MSAIPDDLKYASSHEWVRDNGDGTFTIGISDHAQELLGDLVYVEVPDVGANVNAGEACAVVESVKAASDIYSPIDGEVIEVNETLDDTPELVNSDAYGDGWLFRVAGDNDLSHLLDASGYTDVVAEQS